MPPKRKRQADTEDEAAPVKKAAKSKKELLAEARARAKQWAEEEKAKKDKKKPASSAAKAAPKRTPSRKTVTPKKVSTPKAAVKKPSAKKPAASSSVRAVAPAKASTPKSTSKLTRERKMAEARARAKAWAAEEEAKKLSRPKAEKSTSKSRPPPVQQDEDIDSENDESMDGGESEEEEAKESDGEMENTDMDDEEEDVEEEDAEVEVVEVETVEEEVIELEEAVQVEAKPRARMTAPRLPFSSPGRPIATKKRTSAKVEPLPPIAFRAAAPAREAAQQAPLSVQRQFQAEQDRETQEKLELKKQIQQKVMANAVASFAGHGIAKTPALTQQDVVLYMQQQQQQQEQQQAQSPQQEYQYTQPEYEKKRGRPFLLCLSALVAVGAVVGVLVSGVFSHSTSESLTKSGFTAKTLPDCFMDNFELPEGEEAPLSPFACHETSSPPPCPKGGLCVNGHLFSCESKHLQVASDGSQCILNEASNITLAEVESLLTNWTTKCYCDFNGIDFALKSKSEAGFVFPMNKVNEQIKVDERLIAISSDFDTSDMEEGGELLVGFSDEYVETKLSLPTMCWISLVTIGTIRSAVSIIFYALLHTASAIFSVTFTYPIVSIVCLAALLFIRYARSRKEAGKKLLVDVASVRQMAYQRMMADSLEHIVLHLRDGIAMDMHPTNRKGRSYVILDVWPRVVADVRMDNRVKKTSRLVGGKPRDVWQWVANPSK